MITEKNPIAAVPQKADPLPEGGGVSQQSAVPANRLEDGGVTAPTAAPAGASQNDPAYEVGKGRPPLHTRFKPGQSGNPKGRPKGRKSEATLLTELLDGEKIPLRTNGKERGITAREAIFRTARHDAVRGNLKSARFLLERHASAVSGEVGPGDMSAEEQQIVDDYLERLLSERKKDPS